MISNSTPLILLSKIGKLNFLKSLFKTIIIPEAIKKEVLKEDKIDSIVTRKAIEDGWIIIKNPKDNRDLQLGEGENAAINLARENHDSLIIDDALGIKAAQEFKIKTLRTTTIIFMTVKKKLINREQAVDIINELIENGYYISNEYYAKILTELKK